MTHYGTKKKKSAEVGDLGKMDRYVRNMWIDALKNGAYTQVCGQMRPNDTKTTEELGKEGMCVMGVLSHLALCASGLPHTRENWRKYATSSNPTSLTLQWAGLHQQDCSKLMSNNDARKMTFPEFAKFIEEKL